MKPAAEKVSGNVVSRNGELAPKVPRVSRVGRGVLMALLLAAGGALTLADFAQVHAQSFPEGRGGGRAGRGFRGGTDGGGFSAPARTYDEGDESSGAAGRGMGRGFGGGRMRGFGGGRRGATERASYTPIELHGIMGQGRNALVSITDAQTGESQWVALRDPRAKWYVEEINLRKRSAVVNLDGMPITINLITTSASGTPAGMRAGGVVQPPGAFANNAVSAMDNAPDAPDNSDFNASAVAAQILSNIHSGNARSIQDQFATLSSEQRREVFAQIRQLRDSQSGGGNPAAAAGANSAHGVTPVPMPMPMPVVTPVAAPTPSPVAVPMTLPATLPAAHTPVDGANGAGHSMPAH